MKMSNLLRKIALNMTIMALAAISTGAQTPQTLTKLPTETRNAALRYWLAFADLQDPPADKSVTDLLEKTATGEASWNEEKLGPILDQNEAAIWRMQRATKLPDCDWGLEYELGPRASIAYVPKARVLARLNTLEGMRLAAKRDTQKAVDTWLAGIRFSQHLTNGGTLIFALVAKMGMVSNFHALMQAAQAGELTGEQRRQIEAAVRALPETGLDWGQALWYEADPLNIAVKEMAEASDPASYYQGLMGRSAPEHLTIPSNAEIAAYHSLMGRAAEALRLPPDAAAQPLQALQQSTQSLHPFFRDIIPSFSRVNDARRELQAARQKLLQSL
jgi:hypothetical protein